MTEHTWFTQWFAMGMRHIRETCDTNQIKKICITGNLSHVYGPSLQNGPPKQTLFNHGFFKYSGNLKAANRFQMNWKK